MAKALTKAPYSPLPDPPKQAKRKKRPLLRALVALVLAATLLLVLWAAVYKPLVEGPVFLSYRSLTVREGVFNYLYSFYRYRIPASVEFKELGVRDTAAFWASPYQGDVTQGEHYGQVAVQMIRQTLVAAALFDRYSTLSATEAEELKTLQDEVLTADYKGGGSRDTFNGQAEQYGFTYRDFIEGSTLLYKATRAQRALYGTGGLLAPEEDLERVLAEEYACVLMIFVRTKDKFVFDSQGNYVIEDGQYKTEPLSEEEKAAKAAKLAAIASALADGTDSAEFATLWQTHNEDSSQKLSGTYFSLLSDYTAAYAAAFPPKEENGTPIYAAALSLEVGQTATVESEYGTHVLFRMPVAKGAYDQKDLAEYFEDFYEKASSLLYADRLAEECDRIRTTAKGRRYIDSLDFASFPPNKTLFFLP